MIMEENTQLPKDSIIPADKIAFMNEAIEKLRKANRSDYESGDFDAYNHTNAGRYKAFEEVLQWVNPITSYEEKIKVLTYENNRLKGEVEGLRTAGDEASGYIEFLDVQNNRLRKMLSDICEKAGAGKIRYMAIGSRC